MFDIMSDNIQKQFYAAKGFFYETSLDKFDELILMTNAYSVHYNYKDAFKTQSNI